MCMMSAVMDYGRRDLVGFYKRFEVPTPNVFPTQVPQPSPDQSLIRRVEALERMLREAKRYDDETAQPDCESVGKKKLLQDIADKLGVKIEIPE